MIGILAIAGSRREEPRDPGALGVLDAVTVTQAATVEQLHHARPDAGRRRPRPRHVGRSHIAATVNTLVLAYLGASDDALHAGAESGSLEAASCTFATETSLSSRMPRTKLSSQGR